MSLLSVTVKRAKYIGEQSAQFNTYVTLKLQNVKTTTLTVKGSEPVWDQDFLFETSTIHAGLLVEVWSKNIILDRVLGYQFVSLDSLPYNQYDYPNGYEQWFNIDTEQIVMNGEVGGTRDPTGHMLLLDLHFELPFDVDTQGDQLQNKIGYSADYMNQEQYIENCNDYGDYQTNFNHQNQQNSSYGNNYGQLGTPHSSLETSRQNSYEREERQYYDVNDLYNGQYQEDSPVYDNNEGMNDADYDDGALYYNSRPMNSFSNGNDRSHRTVRQLSRKNLERQNTLYDEGQYEQPLGTCSEINYNMNYNEECYDGYGYNQQYGENSYDLTNGKKALPQPPMSYSQSVNDGFGHRGASLPATPISMQRLNRQLPKHSSPTHQSQSRGLPKLTRQLPSSIESAASTFSSLFGVEKASKKPIHMSNEPETQGRSIFSLLSKSKPQVSQPDSYMDHTIYNENYNYAYNSLDSADEMIVIEEKYDDYNNLANGRSLPSVPSYEKTSSLDYDPYSKLKMNSEPHYSKEVPMIGVQQPSIYEESYLGDEYSDSSMYSNSMHMDYSSPKQLKKLPSPSSSASQKAPTGPSIMTAAGAGLSSLFSSISNTLQSPATTSSSLIYPVVTTSSSSMFSSIFTQLPTTTYGGKSLYSSNMNYSNMNIFPTSSFATSSSNSYTTSYTAGSTTKSYTTSYSTSFSDSLATSYKDTFATSYTDILPKNYTDILSTSYKDALSTSYADIVPTSYTDISSTSYTDIVPTSYTDISSTSYKDALSTSYEGNLTTNYTGDLTTSYKNNLTRNYTDDLTTSCKDNSTTNYIDNLKLGYTDELASSKNENLTSTSYKDTLLSNYKDTFPTSYTDTTPVSYKDTLLNSYQDTLPISYKDTSPISYTTSYTTSYLTNYSTSCTTSNFNIPATISTSSISYSPLSYFPVSTCAPVSSYSTLANSYTSVLDKPYTPMTTYDMTNTFDSITSSMNVSVPLASLYSPLSSTIFQADSTATTSAPSLYTLSSMYDTTSSIMSSSVASYTFTSSSITNFDSSSTYIPSMTLGILGHSPILEEDAENELMLEETYENEIPIAVSLIDSYATTVTSSVSLYTSSSLFKPSETINLTKNSYLLTDISEPFYETTSYETAIDDKFEEEYREDYEEGVLPPATTSDSDFLFDPLIPTATTVTSVTSATYTTPSESYFYEDSSYPMNTKLSTIPETVNDIYLSNNDLQGSSEVYGEQLTTPGAYDYTENENDYIASGDLKNTNLYQGSYPTNQSTTATSIITTTSSNYVQSQQAQPEPKKSRFGFGSLFSDGLNVIGSSVNSIKSTATNLAGGAVGVVGGVVGAATAAAQSAQSATQSSNQNTNQNACQNQNYNQQIIGNVQNTTCGPSISTVTTLSQSSSTKLTKQVSEMYDEQNDEYTDPYKQDAFYEPDYFNEEEENRYLAENNSPDNNNYMSPTYANQTDDYLSLNDNNNDTYGTYSDKKSQLNNNSSKLNQNDSNNNANGGYNYSSFDDQMDKTKLGLNDDDYYDKMYDEKEKDDRHYEEEFDNEYGTDTNTISKQMMQKQMSILDDDAHDDYMNDKNKMMHSGEQKTIDEEYLDEFDENGMLIRKSDNKFMDKNESSLQNDHQSSIDQSQNNHQETFHDIENDGEIDQFDIEMKQKKLVSINCDEDVIIHEKPREKRTAKQRWHWAYNRIVHQAQVSEIPRKFRVEDQSKPFG